MDIERGDDPVRLTFRSPRQNVNSSPESHSTFNHVFLLDSAFVIFHNSVPRMVLQEMTIDVTCPEDIFQASTPEEFMSAIKSHPLRSSPPLLTDCVRTLCAEHPDPAILTHIHNGTALTLFTIATGKMAN